MDVDARGGITLEEAGELLSVTRERVRQLERAALVKMQQNAAGLKELLAP